MHSSGNSLPLSSISNSAPQAKTLSHSHIIKHAKKQLSNTVIKILYSISFEGSEKLIFGGWAELVHQLVRKSLTLPHLWIVLMETIIHSAVTFSSHQNWVKICKERSKQSLKFLTTSTLHLNANVLSMSETAPAKSGTCSSYCIWYSVCYVTEGTLESGVRQNT